MRSARRSPLFVLIGWFLAIPCLTAAAGERLTHSGNTPRAVDSRRTLRRIEALRYDRAVPLLKDIVKGQGTSSCGLRAASTLKAMERRQQADAGAPEQTQGESLTAEQARQAVLALIRSRPQVFVGAPDLDRLAKLPLKERGDGEYSFGAFVVNLQKRWYAAHVGGDDERHDAWSYNGSFVRRDGQWIATEPKVTEFHQPPKKVTETPQPPK
jgi:hypothetical protein